MKDKKHHIYLDSHERSLLTKHLREADEMFQFIKYEDKRKTVGFLIHSFSTFDRVKRWNVNTNAQDAKKPKSLIPSRLARVRGQ